VDAADLHWHYPHKQLLKIDVCREIQQQSKTKQ
jgi:hypothetical protein